MLNIDDLHPIHQSPRAGAVLAAGAIALPNLLVFQPLSIDIGTVSLEQARLQGSADRARPAAAPDLPDRG